jgi:hypothetical protein
MSRLRRYGVRWRVAALKARTRPHTPKIPARGDARPTNKISGYDVAKSTFGTSRTDGGTLKKSPSDLKPNVRAILKLQEPTSGGSFFPKSRIEFAPRYLGSCE